VNRGGLDTDDARNSANARWGSVSQLLSGIECEWGGRGRIFLSKWSRTSLARPASAAAWPVKGILLEQGRILGRRAVGAVGKERGQNYAGAAQDVFAGYGEKNRERLRDIQSKYDPEGVFSRLQPGGFKL
jgi:hypothetical protein